MRVGAFATLLSEIAMRVPILVFVAFVLLFSVFGMLILLLRLTNIERDQRQEGSEVRNSAVQVFWVPIY